MAKKNLAVILDNIRSGNNVGSFFRTCDAFGVERLVLCGITGVPPSVEIRKTALGAEQTVSWSYFDSTMEAVLSFKSEGYTVLAVEQADGAVMLPDFVADPSAKYVLVFGNEVDGVSPQVLSKCDSILEIPQCGMKKSLNVAVAGGVVIWKFANL